MGDWMGATLDIQVPGASGGFRWPWEQQEPLQVLFCILAVCPSVLQQPHKVGALLSQPVLQMGELRHREIKPLAQLPRVGEVLSGRAGI